VLIAIIVLAFGLLGFALLQTMNVRFVQSANYRTQATNLAYDLIEQMRSSAPKPSRWRYTKASFSAGSVKPSGPCTWPNSADVTPPRRTWRAGNARSSRRWAEGQRQGDRQRRPGHRGHQLG
jgi:type IV pilus assembly protein PilV